MASFSFPSRALRSERAFPHASFRSDSLILPESQLNSSLQPSTSAVPFVLTDSRESSWFLKSRWRAWDGGSHVFVDHTHYYKSCSRIGRALVNNDVYVREGIKLFTEKYQFEFLAIWSSNSWNRIFRECLSWQLKETPTSKEDLQSKTIITHSNTMLYVPVAMHSWQREMAAVSNYHSPPLVPVVFSAPLR